MEDKDELTEIVKIIDQMAETWKAPVVPRKMVKEFSGGLLNPKTLANMDSKGEGPEGSFVICNQRAYPVESLVKFLKDRVSLKWSRNAPAKRSEGIDAR